MSRMGSLKRCNERKIKSHRGSFLLADGHWSPLGRPEHWACAITSGLEVSLLPSVHMRAELRGQIQEWPHQGPALGLPWAHVRKSLSLSGPGTAGIRLHVSSPRALGPARGPKLQAQEGTGATTHQACSSQVPCSAACSSVLFKAAEMRRASSPISWVTKLRLKE